MLDLEDNIHRRLFIVGCSRSGTTLLQGLLASHPDVYTFPETGLLLRARGMRFTLPWAYLGLTTGKEGKALRVLGDQIGEKRLRQRLPARHWHLNTALARSLSVFDELALEAGKGAWIEKTPRHFQQADWITRHIPRAHVIHLIRDGREVVASIVDRARRYPTQFAKQSDPRYAVRLWNRALRVTARLAARPGHTVVAYEALSCEPERVMPKLCELIGLPFHQGVLTPAQETAHIRDNETWKTRSRHGVSRPPGKFNRVFTATDQTWISARLALPTYRELRYKSRMLGL